MSPMRLCDKVMLLFLVYEKQLQTFSFSDTVNLRVAYFVFSFGDRIYVMQPENIINAHLCYEVAVSSKLKWP